MGWLECGEGHSARQEEPFAEFELDFPHDLLDPICVVEERVIWRGSV